MDSSLNRRSTQFSGSMEPSDNDIDEAFVRRFMQLNEDDRFITRCHFHRLSTHTGLTQTDLDIIFDALDTNGDGVILLDDLLSQWQQVSADLTDFQETNFSPESQESAHSSASSDSDNSQPSSSNHNSKSDCTPKVSLLSAMNDNVKVISFNGSDTMDHSHSRCVSNDFMNNDIINSEDSKGHLHQSDIDKMEDIFIRSDHRGDNENQNASPKTSYLRLELSNQQCRNAQGNEVYSSEQTGRESDALIAAPYADLISEELASTKENLNTEPDASFVSQYTAAILTNSEHSSAYLVMSDNGEDCVTTSPHSSSKIDPVHRQHNHVYRDFDAELHSRSSSNVDDMEVNCHMSNPSLYYPNRHSSSHTKEGQTSSAGDKPHLSKLSKNSPTDQHVPRTVHSYSRFTGERIYGVKSETESKEILKSNETPPIKLHQQNVQSQPTNSSNLSNLKITTSKKSSSNENHVSRSLASPETVYEYDSARLFPKSPTGRKLRHKNRRPDSETKKKLFPNVQVLRQEFPGDLDTFSKLSQEQVCELYQNLHGAENPELVSQFENILLNVIKDVRQYKIENERLEKTYRKEKDEHDKHLRRMEEEMELQVQSVEERVRKQEKEKLESEKIDLRVELDSEILMLQQNLKKLQHDGMNRLEKNQEDHLMSLKKRLEEIHTENRSLKSELTDAHTNLALVKTEMSTVRQQLDEKAYELEVENKTVEDYVNEQDNLRRQLQLLHEANKNLLDTNDNLREMLDTPTSGTPSFKRTTSTDSGASARSTRSVSPNFNRKGSLMSDYVDKLSPGNRPLLEHSFQDEVSMMPRFLGTQYPCGDPYEEDSIAEELDSGHSTLRDVNDANDDTELDSVSVHSDHRRGKRHRRHRSNLRVQLEEDPESHDEMDTDGETPMSPETEVLCKASVDHRRSASVGSRSSNRSHRSYTRDDSIMSQSSRSSRSSMRRQLPAIPKVVTPNPVKAPKEPDRMYKIALAGDAAVGKSTFIVRLCKGKFVANLSSTLGVDFQTKMLEVDGNSTALQLWDTAGQERFRSIARTYFRRADGVLLLYDVTYERSFLNIREWLATIEEGAVKKIPIMLVGNKIDARLEAEQQGRRTVKYEDGLKLSKEIDALFIETSSKDGDNVSEAVIELTRMLRTNEDLEVQTVGLQLHEAKDKRKSSCCKFS